MGDATERLATLQRGLEDLRGVLSAIEECGERAALADRVARLEERASRWSVTPPSERVVLLNEVFDATLEASDLRRRSGQYPVAAIRAAK